jgi:hypothetical protein
MANRFTHDETNDSCECFHCNYDEDHHEERNSFYPFASEDDEHRHFDNLERAADIRSSR